MQILFVANRIPYPPYRGDKLKIYNLAKQLTKQHELHLITFVADEEEWKYKAELEKLYASVTLIKQSKLRSYWGCISGIFSKVPFQVLYFKNAKFKSALNAVIAQRSFDAIHVQHLRMAQYFIGNKPKTRVILDLPDAFSLYWKRRLEKATTAFQKIFIKMEHHRLLSYEKHMAMFDLNLACSKEDINYLKSKHGFEHIQLLSNGVDTSTFKPSEIAPVPKRILFTGNMDYAPNIDGAAYFVEEIFPLIEKEIPGVQFIIAGQRPVKKVTDLAKENIQITGFIPKLNEMYATAEVVVSPLRIGAGTQNKVLESMAMGIPVVCTDIGFEGLGIANGEGVFKETTAMGFAKKVIELLNNPELREITGKKATEVIKNKFSWDRIAQQLADYLKG
jgi:sugar transferase (PEP-CTERM/EpsH1 system associated)